MSGVQLLVSLLDTNSGRGKLLRLCQYGSTAVSGTPCMSKDKAYRLQQISQQLSSCRTILRLCDDLPMLSHTLGYGLGKKEEGLLIRALSILQNIIDQIFFPTEHIAWAADAGILKIPSERWWNYGVYCWFSSLSLGILKNIIMLVRLRQCRLQNSQRIQMEEGIGNYATRSVHSEGSGSASSLSEEEIANLKDLLSNCADIMLAIHYMPSWFPGSGKLSTFYVGFFGVISTVIPLHTLLRIKIEERRLKRS